MSRFNGLFFVLTIGAIAAAMFWSGTRGQALQADSSFKIDPAKVAVIDIEQITNDFLEAKGSLDSMREKFARKRRSLDEQRQTLRDMQSEAEVYVVGSERRLEIEKQIAIKAGELKVLGEAAELDQNRERAKLTAEVYEKARQTISDYAQEKGLDLILLRQGGSLKSTRFEDVSSNILIRTVIWNRPDLDITAAIFERMK